MARDRSSLLTKPLMTTPPQYTQLRDRQHAFDCISMCMMEQWKKCLVLTELDEYETEYWITSDRYRHDGRETFIGCLLDGIMLCEEELLMPIHLLRRVNPIVHHRILNLDDNFLHDMERIHKYYTPIMWHFELREYAITWNLNHGFLDDCALILGRPTIDVDTVEGRWPRRPTSAQIEQLVAALPEEVYKEMNWAGHGD